jgi:ABC-type branched-subunit amino acid transport system permease subunit
LKGQLLILLGYAGALACSAISGASFGAIYFIMQAEKTTFQSAFQSVSVVMVGGYAIAIAVLAGVCIYLYKQNNPVKSA